MKLKKNKLPYIIRLIISIVVLITAILAIWGFYPVHLMDIQITPLLQRCLRNPSTVAIILLSIVLIATLVFGRFYCSLVCPFGILQEVFALIFNKKKNESVPNAKYKYLIAGISFGLLFGGSALILRHVDPYTIFGSASSLSIFGICVGIAILILVFFKNRLFCTNICPVGALLGIISKISILKIYMDKDTCVKCGMCSKACPSGCIDFKNKKIDNETCVKCLKCYSVCPKSSIRYGIEKKEEEKFNINRREVIYGIGALALFAGAYMAGIKFVKDTTKKIKDIILPPGAENTTRMEKTCLNCNLCVKNCTNKILKPADENFNFVHIDYSQGKGYCEYNCNKCSTVCPSGAIKKITLEQKQKKRIAMAYIHENICHECGICVSECPAHAISQPNGKTAQVDGSKCIGCGKCKTVCPFKAIDISAIKKQS